MVTYFKNKKDVYNPSFITLDEMVHLIKEDEDVANEIRHLRLAHRLYKEERNPEKQHERKLNKDSIKAELPGFVPSGEFTARNNNSCLEYHSRIVLDIDHIDEPGILKNKVKKDKSVLMAFLSPSGDGLKVIHSLDCQGIDKDELNEFHRQAFLSLEKYYKDKYGIDIDTAGKEISRLCFISHDPIMYYNPNPKAYKFTYLKKEKFMGDMRDKILISDKYYKPYGIWIGKQEDAIDILKDLCNWQEENSICIVRNYNNWISVMFAIKNITGDNEKGEELFQRISSTYDRYNSDEIKRKWNDKSNQIDHKKDIPTIGSIIWLAGIYGYKFKLKGKTSKIAYLNIYTAKLIERGIFIRMNTLSKRLQIKKADVWINVTEKDLINISLDVLEGAIKTKDVKEFLTDCSPEINPAEEFLNNLPEWDQVDRFILLSDTLRSKNIDEKLKLIYLKKWFIGVVHGMLNSPKKAQYNENVIILMGKQGIGKTRWAKTLLPKEYHEYFAVKNLDPQLKDDQILLSEKFIVLLDESSQLLRKSTADLKSLTSTEKFSVRAPYAAINDDYYRVASLIGSSNDYQILNDPTGNRRFWIIEIEKADFDHEIDMYQLWSQAKNLYEKGESHWLERVEFELQAKSVEQYEKINTYEDLINVYIEVGTNKDEFMSATEIIRYFSERTSDKLPHQLFPNTLGSYLNKSGFERNHRNNKWGYFVRKKGPESEEQFEEITVSELKAKELIDFN